MGASFVFRGQGQIFLCPLEKVKADPLNLLVKKYTCFPAITGGISRTCEQAETVQHLACA